MEGYSVEQCVRIIKFYYQISDPFEKLSVHYAIFILAITVLLSKRLVAKFESSGYINNQPTPVCHRHANSADNIAVVRESVRENLRKSITCCSQELVLSATSTWRILNRDLGLYPYKIQLTQELKVNKH